VTIEDLWSHCRDLKHRKQHGFDLVNETVRQLFDVYSDLCSVTIGVDEKRIVVFYDTSSCFDSTIADDTWDLQVVLEELRLDLPDLLRQPGYRWTRKTAATVKGHRL